MKPETATRRRFLGTAAAAGAGLWLAGRTTQPAAAAGPAPAGKIRLGAPAFAPTDDPEQLALAHRKLGYRAAYCPPVGLGDTKRISDIAAAFARHDVVIAEVGRWVNVMDADPQKRTANLKTVTDGLALAEAVGARCCVDIAGSYSSEAWYGPDPRNVSPEFFDAAVENARKIIDAVKPKRAKFCYEMMGWSLPDGPDSYLAMIKAVDRPAFGVHLDPCNLVNSPRRFYRNAELLDECFDKLGPWITSCHAKDVAWQVEMQVHFREVPLGDGELDYRTYLKRLAALPGDVPLMVEHMQGPDQYDACRRYLFDLGREIGVGFE
jgi:sugar phosphate isomerase/epimerase